MDEYITRKAVLDLQHRLYHSPLSTVVELSPTYIISPEAVQRIPAADVVARDCYDRLLAENDRLRKERPVVRCGECAYCEWKDEVCTYGWCKRISTYKMRDEYCSDGERRDGDGE